MKIIEEPLKPKRKRFCKNTKKAWRKKIDITDIEDKLENERREERFGGALGERPFEELFSMDLGNIDIKSTSGPNSKNKRISPLAKALRNEKKKRSQNELPKCHEFINGLPGVKPISKKGPVMKQTNPKKMKIARKLVSKGTPTAFIALHSHFMQQRHDLKVNRTYSRAKKLKAEDIWNDEAKENQELEKTYGVAGSSYMKDSLLYYKRQTKQAPLKPPAIRFKTPTSIPAVIVPKAGASYNPSHGAHQKLLRKAISVINKETKAKQREDRWIAKCLPTAADGITQEEYNEEMMEGLPFYLNPHKEAKEAKQVKGAKKSVAKPQDLRPATRKSVPKTGDVPVPPETLPLVSQSIEEEVTCVGRAQPKKKSKQRRRKELTRKFEKKKQVQKERKEKLGSEVDKLNDIMREVKQNERRLKSRRTKKQRLALQAKFKTKRVCLDNFVEEDITVPLGYELQGSIRKMEPNTDAITSVMKGFERRNIIAPRPTDRKRKRLCKKKVKRIPKKTEEMKRVRASLKDI